MNEFSESSPDPEFSQNSEYSQASEPSQDPDTFGLFSTLSELRVDPEGLNLSEFDTSEPLGILVELAKNEKIDPWDIDIVKLTDSFLGRIEELRQLDLRVSSRTLLYSAILLRMKSSGILREEEAEAEDDEADFFEEPDFPEPGDFTAPKLPVRRKATRPVTLNELISELKKAEKALSRKREKKRKNEARDSDKPAPFEGDVRGIAHEEAIVERVDLVWEKLAGLFGEGKASHVPFSRFLEGSSDRVMDYISLLFLASSKKVWLCQEELFGELYIYPGDESGFSSGKKSLPSGGPEVSDPFVSDPSVSDPSVSDPSVSDPSVSDTTVSDLAVSDPSASENPGPGPEGQKYPLPLPSEPVGFAGPKLPEKPPSFEANSFEE